MLLSSNKTSKIPFAFEGTFLGFFRDVFGKRRIVCRIGHEDVFLKIPKSLRREVDGQLKPGRMIRVSGHELARGERNDRVVLRVEGVEDDVCVTCPIRVCAKKNCWRNGGREVWNELERRIEEGGLRDVVSLKAVDCLDHCKKGPNVEYAGEEFHRCTGRDIENILQQVPGNGL